MNQNLYLEIRNLSEDFRSFWLTVGEEEPKRLKFRRRFTLSAADALALLQSGNAPQELVTTVTNEVSRWFLDTDLDDSLTGALMKADGGPVRLLIQVDDSIISELADLPMELTTLSGRDKPLLLSEKVDAIIHLLPTITGAPPPPAAHNPPLRVLIARSSPKDLNVKVPDALPLRDKINALVPPSLPGLVQVDVLSSEPQGTPPAALPPVTWPVLKEKLSGPTGYDVVVYLGHGDFQLSEGGQRTGTLLFEHPNGEDSDPVDSATLRTHMQGQSGVHPPPVMLLCGCLTAAEMDALEDEVRERAVMRLPRSMLGIRGVAQSLVGETGVQIAVGMRYRLEKADATTFIGAFFKSLLKDKPGNVESAVRAGRFELSAGRLYPPSWSAPTIYRTSGAEPTFPFLVNPSVTVSPEEALRNERDLERRVKAWETMAKHPNIPLALDVIDEAEKDLSGRILDKGAALLHPSRTLAVAETEADAPVQLRGPLSVRSLDLRFTVGGEGVRVLGAQLSQALTDRGFVLSPKSLEGQSHTFTLSSPSAEAAPLPEGELFRVQLRTGKFIAVVYPISVTVEGVEPADTRVQTLGNALIVPGLFA